jgi:hypothetical protein
MKAPALRNGSAALSPFPGSDPEGEWILMRKPLA